MTNQPRTAPFPFSDLPGAAESRKFFLAATRFQANAAKAVLRYQIEALGFLKHRCEQDVKLIEDLVADDEFSDSFDVVSTYMQNAASEYAAEAGKVAQIGSRVASETARQVREEANEVIDDMAARTVA